MTPIDRTVTPEEIRTLSDLFEEASILFFSRFENRVYCGRRPAQRVTGSDVTPVNVEKSVPLSDEDCTDVAARLNAI